MGTITPEFRAVCEEAITLLTKGIPVEWDRYTASSDMVGDDLVTFIQVYGWILPEKKDFVIYDLRHNHTTGLRAEIHTTSSAKYSRQMCDNWNCMWSECHKWEDEF